MERRAFLRHAAGALLVLPFGTFLVQCTGDDDVMGEASPTEPDPTPPAAPPRVAGGNIVYTSSETNLHAHAFSVAQNALISPPAGGVSGVTTEAQLHVHTLAITEAQLRQAAALQVVKVRTGDALGHSHVFTIVRV